MKTLLIFLLSASVALAQNVAVKFYGVGNAQGLPQFWPQVVQPCGTKTSYAAGFAVMTGADLQQIISTNRAAYDAVEAAKAAQVKTAQDANLSKLVALYNLIPTARTWTASTLSTCTNIDQSLASGTNTTAQLVLQIRRINGEVNRQATINSGVLELLQRLGPVLREMYKPDNDTTE